jgi:NADPH-dependent 2,4-dienoyl-CoA reductase/sulfur reductase-like enzyme/nitrite reductase/ring-hydroxylating ferredoxin subunit
MADTKMPDFKAGVPGSRIPDGGMLAGTAGDEEVVVIRRGGELFAVGAYCTHYHGPLAQGVVVGDTLRCPLHHACFSIRTGEALRAPAFDPIACWQVDERDGAVFVGGKQGSAMAADLKPVTPSAGRLPAPRALRSVVIVGGGAAGFAAADALRRNRYQGALTMISADESPPVDRPNLSKDFLMGTAPADWIPLRPPEYYDERRIDLVLGARVSGVDTRRRVVSLESGKQYDFDALLLATGAEPVRLNLPGAVDSEVCYLRTFADSRAIVGKAAAAHSVVVVGASFIGLEVAAALRSRKIDVHVVGPEKVPMARVLGEPAGRFIQELHESNGVRFHLGSSVSRVNGRQISLSDGAVVDADFLVVGAGVRPTTSLAEKAGVAVDHGVLVNEYLETSSPGVYAAGDIARWPDPRSGGRIRVEHWVVAERQGQAAARNILGFGEKFDAVPFFWSQHYDVTINYVGHAEQWDSADLDGSFAARDFAISYRRAGRLLAVASAGRERQGLQTEIAMETGSAAI